MKRLLFGIAAVALLASGSFASMATVQGADHGDSPSNNADKAADGADLYAFRSPADPNNVVIALDLNANIIPSDNDKRPFPTALSYTIDIDRTGDAVPEATVRIRGQENPASIVIEGLSAQPITVPITKAGEVPKITTAGAIKAFAGRRDDAFVFDVAAFQAFVASPAPPVSGLRRAGAGPAVDGFAGQNIDSIIIELPVTAVTGGTSPNAGTVKVVANIYRSGNSIDRLAIPAVNTALITSGLKDYFNAATDESKDMAQFGPTVKSQIEGLRAAVDPLFGGAGTQDGGPLGKLTSDQLTGALLPFVVTIDFSKPLVFPNGRQLQDDVIDTVLGLVLNRGGAKGISDGVSVNDKPLLSSFPYEADPWLATGAAPATGGLQAPNTGDGGLLSDGTMWTASAALFVLAIAFGGMGAFATLRNRR